MAQQQVTRAHRWVQAAAECTLARANSRVRRLALTGFLGLDRRPHGAALPRRVGRTSRLRSVVVEQTPMAPSAPGAAPALAGGRAAHASLAGRAGRQSAP